MLPAQLGHRLYVFDTARTMRAGTVNAVKSLPAADRSEDLIYISSAILTGIDPAPDVMSFIGGGILRGSVLMVGLGTLFGEDLAANCAHPNRVPYAGYSR